MTSLLNFLINIIDLYTLLIFAYVIISWLFHFRVLRHDNIFLIRIYDSLKRLTDPPLNYLRRFMPDLGGIDLAPVALIFIIWLFKGLLSEHWPH